MDLGYDGFRRAVLGDYLVAGADGEFKAIFGVAYIGDLVVIVLYRDGKVAVDAAVEVRVFIGLVQIVAHVENAFLLLA